MQTNRLTRVVQLKPILIALAVCFAVLQAGCGDDKGSKPLDGGDAAAEASTDGTVDATNPDMPADGVGDAPADGGADAPADGGGDAPGDGQPSEGGGEAVGGDGTTEGVVGDGGDGPATDLVVVGDAVVIITNDAGQSYSCYPTTCAGKLLACGDCVDNDGDGLVDSRDPECLGPCMNNEGPSLLGGVGGNVSNNCNVDCYFDFGDGAGNDDCHWNHKCDPLAPRASICAYDPNYAGTPQGQQDCPAQQSQKCEKQCLPYTPNGCDCFGCCTFPSLAGLGPNGTDAYVFIGAVSGSGGQKVGTCTYADVTDTSKCPRCTPVQACLNTCERCEICIGKPTIPSDCFAPPPDASVDGPPNDFGVTDGVSPDGPTSDLPQSDGTPADGTPTDTGTTNPRCPGGEQPCGLPTDPACPRGTYCITGCCITIIIN